MPQLTIAAKAIVIILWTFFIYTPSSFLSKDGNNSG
ncbi:unnamed protein product [Mycetohabitans rhizoxinica HKI 454]|uniref:Uncharacterized protein n=1 Tax=Mycetohabitans rhizoxinica (strain DSM 19002 / CIP 109453 / HKI 454) TaxID=882378 RepID=E5AT28_MYCRK|nr:unnamed protein product [Mycetohabitans rhizoxinica HKI 454]